MRKILQAIRFPNRGGLFRKTQRDTRTNDIIITSSRSNVTMDDNHQPMKDGQTNGRRGATERTTFSWQMRKRDG